MALVWNIFNPSVSTIPTSSCLHSYHGDYNSIVNISLVFMTHIYTTQQLGISSVTIAPTAYNFPLSDIDVRDYYHLMQNYFQGVF